METAYFKSCGLLFFRWTILDSSEQFVVMMNPVMKHGKQPLDLQYTTKYHRCVYAPFFVNSFFVHV